MGFQSVKLINFRNLVDKEIDLGKKYIYLVGENGQGKTNFLEALYYLCFGSSFRTRSDRDITREGQNSFSLAAKFTSENSFSGISEKINIKFINDKKEIFLNDSRVYDRKELVKNIPGIIFCHDDILFITGTPERRRLFFDQTLSLFDIEYIDYLRKYKKILKERNFLLKKKISDRNIIAVYDQQLAYYGLKIQEFRVNIIEDFKPIFSTCFALVSGMEGNMEIKYRPSWRNCNNEEDILSVLKEKWESDKNMGASSSGPHRDIYQFIYEGKDFLKKASTGQNRLLSLLLRVAQARFLSGLIQKKPVLLVDDVLLELDGRRRKLFLENIPEFDQIIFTFLPGDEKELMGNRNESLQYSVKNGKMILI